MSMKGISKNYFNKDYFIGRKNSNYQDYQEYDNDEYWEFITQKVKQYKLKGNALDIGCAYGYLLKRLKPYFKQISGIDISKHAITKAKIINPEANLKTINLNTQQLPFKDELFDLITAIDVIEHTNDVNKTIKKIVRKLKREGLIIITVPIKDSLLGKLFNIFDKDKSHVNILSQKILLNILQKNRLKIIEKNYFHHSRFGQRIKGIPSNLEIIAKKL
ncbi:MAG: methyltransferase domain-containing protein [Candidatus Moranbacteria bacterium]|nr:methyltransferase domain-containing protein [Candidatus Moranbacteria bacterium]